MSAIQSDVDEILQARSSSPSQRNVLAAITGIDGRGKGYVAARIVDALLMNGVRAVAINIDDRWLDLPNRRFNARKPAEHFTFMRSASRRCSHSLLSFHCGTTVP